MSIIGVPTQWADLIDPMLPEILKLVISSWEEMPLPAPDDKEDNITIALCRTLRQSRTARGLMFQIHTQLVELEPATGEDPGRQDIVFVPLVPARGHLFLPGEQASECGQGWQTADLCVRVCDAGYVEVCHRLIFQGSPTWRDDWVRA